MNLPLKRFSKSSLLRTSAFACSFFLLPGLAGAADTPSGSQHPVLTGQAAFTDALHESPGIRRHLTWADLPAPAPDQSVDNGPSVVARPANAWPIAPKGFKVDLYATGLDNPRLLRVAPNGDLFLAESQTGKIKVFRGVGPDGKPQQASVFATGLNLPFGIAFYPLGPNPQWIFIGNTDGIVRFPYRNGDLVARGPEENIDELPGGGHLRGGGHWTRDLIFSKDGSRLFASVGSHSNIDDPDTHPEEFHRADVLEFTPTGKFVKVYASGLRNCVGEAINPTTGELWCSTNERDGLGNNLVPDYVTHVQEGGFYGWPWFYFHGPNGGLQDPRHPGKHPELQAKVLTPDILVNPHFASLEMFFYTGSEFPAEYKGDGFAAEHGSWNRAQRSGYEVIRLPMKNGHATGEYEDFLTGFVLPDGTVWGRPVGVAQASDGSLFVSDDGSRSIWHVTYSGSPIRSDRGGQGSNGSGSQGSSGSSDEVSPGSGGQGSSVSSGQGSNGNSGQVSPGSSGQAGSEKISAAPGTYKCSFEAISDPPPADGVGRSVCMKIGLHIYQLGKLCAGA